jgi:hypothetical protein
MERADRKPYSIAENAVLRQRVAELERLVGALKGRLWPTA